MEKFIFMNFYTMSGDRNVTHSVSFIKEKKNTDSFDHPDPDTHFFRLPKMDYSAQRNMVMEKI